MLSSGLFTLKITLSRHVTWFSIHQSYNSGEKNIFDTYGKDQQSIFIELNRETPWLTPCGTSPRVITGLQAPRVQQLLIFNLISTQGNSGDVRGSGCISYCMNRLMHTLAASTLIQYSCTSYVYLFQILKYVLNKSISRLLNFKFIVLTHTLSLQ